MIECEVCGKTFSKKGIGSHKWRVHGDGIGFKPVKPGTASPRRGLTKDNDEALSRMSETLKQRYTSGEIVPWHSGLNKFDPRVAASAAKVSNTVKRKRDEGTWHLSFSRARTHEYKGFKFHGKWEVEFAKYLDRLGVTWTRCIETFPYTFEGVQRHYTPDFYITDCDVYVEVKGYRTLKDDAKWSCFPKKLLVLRGEDLALLGLNIQYKSCA